MNLKPIRIQANKTQAEVAKAINITQFTYSNYENGKSEPNIQTLCKLADYYHTSVDQIIGRDTHIINLNALDSRDKSLIQDILAMNELQKLRTEAYFNGLFQR